MSEFDEKYIYPLIKNRSVIYLCYIDDIFMVCIKSESELRQWMSKINKKKSVRCELRQWMSKINKKKSVRSDFKSSKESIEFLDTLVYTNSKNRLQTKSIPYSQALRIKSICSTFEEYRKYSQDLAKRFFEKGYNESIVRKQIGRVDHLDKSLLLNHFKPKLKDSIPFLAIYTPVLPNIKEIINKHWHILSIDSSFKEVFNNLRPMIVFRKNASLKQLTRRSKMRTKQKPYLHKQQP